MVKTKTQVSLEDLLAAGCHFGHQVRRWNPKIAPYIYGEREGVHIFDLARTREALLEAVEAVKTAASEGKVILFVGTKRQAKELVQAAAEKVSMPHVTSRWLGGTLTNFSEMRRSLDKLSDLKTKREAGEFAAYTKHERLLIDREIGDLEKTFGGITSLKEPPDMLFIIDTHKEAIAVREAKMKAIPVVGIVDSNADPNAVDYPIPANDDAVKSISFILEVITGAIEEGKKKIKPIKSVTSVTS